MNIPSPTKPLHPYSFDVRDMDRVIRDGKVAVLVSPGCGSGWSTWVNKEFKEWAMFSPAVVAWVEGGKKGDIDEIVKRELGSEIYLYTGGADDLEIEWVPQGTLFRIVEYDGSETMEKDYETFWWQA